MNPDEIFSPERLALARQRRGLFKQELAARVGVTPRAVSAWEKGERPSDANLVSLATVLNFPQSFFFGDAPPILRTPAFRSLARMTARDRDMALAAGSEAVALDQWVDGQFQRPDPNIPDLRGVDPESAAEILRAEWGLGYQPIANFVHRVEMHGVRVYSLVHDGGQIDAFSDWQGDKPYMFLNTVKTAERGRMDASHELGHLTLHAHTGGPSSKLEEDQAQAFASAFLMPAKAVIATMPSRITPNTMIDAKLRWGVSAIAYVHRLWSLGRLSKSAYRSLAIRIRTNPAAEPGPRIQRETSQVLAKVMGQNPAAVRREIVKHLRIPLANLDEITFGLALTPVAGMIRPIGPANTSAPPSGRLRLMN